VDFRPRSWIVVALLALLAALPTVAFAVIVALLFHEEAERKDGTAFPRRSAPRRRHRARPRRCRSRRERPRPRPSVALAPRGGARVRRLGRPAGQRDPL